MRVGCAEPPAGSELTSTSSTPPSAPGTAASPSPSRSTPKSAPAGRGASCAAAQPHLPHATAARRRQARDDERAPSRTRRRRAARARPAPRAGSTCAATVRAGAGAVVRRRAPRPGRPRRAASTAAHDGRGGERDGPAQPAGAAPRARGRRGGLRRLLALARRGEQLGVGAHLRHHARAQLRRRASPGARPSAAPRAPSPSSSSSAVQTGHECRCSRRPSRSCGRARAERVGAEQLVPVRVGAVAHRPAPSRWWRSFSSPARMRPFTVPSGTSEDRRRSRCASSRSRRPAPRRRADPC